MKRILLMGLFVFVLSMQTGVMAKGQWIYPYAHPTVAVEVAQSDC